MMKHAISSFLVAVVATVLALFLPAGTVYYWQGLVFIALFFVPMALITVYLFRCSPELLKKRLDTKERRPIQAILAKLFYITVCSFFVISGFDKRYSWSSIPLAVIVVSQVLFLAGYIFLFLTFKENKHLAHTVVVTKGQQVITTGPYAVVRHPMYLSELIMFIFAPLALGSYWALIPNILLIAILVVRIVTEEQLLLEELNGYRDYTEKTQYRLIPGIW